jgi:hypothetical protein
MAEPLRKRIECVFRSAKILTQGNCGRPKAKVASILPPPIAAFNVIAGGLSCWFPLSSTSSGLTLAPQLAGCWGLFFWKQRRPWQRWFAQSKTDA